MNIERKIELLCKARNLLHKQENGQAITRTDITLAHDYVDMVLDALVDERFLKNQPKKVTRIMFDD